MMLRLTRSDGEDFYVQSKAVTCVDPYEGGSTVTLICGSERNVKEKPMVVVKKVDEADREWENIRCSRCGGYGTDAWGCENELCGIGRDFEDARTVLVTSHKAKKQMEAMDGTIRPGQEYLRFFVVMADGTKSTSKWLRDPREAPDEDDGPDYGDDERGERRYWENEP